MSYIKLLNYPFNCTEQMNVSYIVPALLSAFHNANLKRSYLDDCKIDFRSFFKIIICTFIIKNSGCTITRTDLFYKSKTVN